MRPARLLVLAAALALAVASGGCVQTLAWSASTSPDGRVLTVVGARVRRGFGPWVAQPLEWHCVRDEQGQLFCRRIEQQLPRPPG